MSFTRSVVFKLKKVVDDLADSFNSDLEVPDDAVNDDGEQVRAFLIGEGGRFEVGDPTPTAPPVGYTPPNDLRFLIERVMNQMRERAEMDGFDSPEDAEDFDVGDDFDPTVALTDSEIMAMGDDELRRYLMAHNKSGGAGAPPAQGPNGKPANSPPGPTVPEGAAPAQASPPAAPPAQSTT